MRLVVDANILFAALIKEASTAELLLNERLQLFAPEFLFLEFSKYKDLILRKTHRSREEFSEFMEILKERIRIIPKRKILPFMERAEKISPDPKDSVYLGLAFMLECDIWSNDKQLSNDQDKVRVFSTKELVEKII